MAASYTRIADVYGVMGILRIPLDGEEDARFLAVVVDCKSVGRIDAADIYSISVVGASLTVSPPADMLLYLSPAPQFACAHAITSHAYSAHCQHAQTSSRFRPSRTRP
jgi:hypothetical protein